MERNSRTVYFTPDITYNHCCDKDDNSMKFPLYTHKEYSYVKLTQTMYIPCYVRNRIVEIYIRAV